MYTIYNVVWGVQITKELQEVFDAREESIDENHEEWDTFPGSFSKEDGGWFTTTYSGMADHEVGWIGKSVYSFDFKGSPVEMMNKMASFNEQDAVMKEIEAVPEWLRKHFPTPDWMFVVSTS